MTGVSCLSLLVMEAPAQAQGYSLRAGSQSNQGGNVQRGTAGATANAATSQALQAAALAQRSQASLLHSVQAIQAMQAAQSAARNAAIAPNGPNNLGTLVAVPNGLAVNGLVPDSGLASPGVANPVTTWVNARTPTQAVVQGQTTVTVQQTGQQALLNWNSFNIGRNTTLNFDQSLGGENVGQWVAVNRIAPNIAPSQILGSMTAQGQVYVLNQNGIIFGGSSQVNVGALVASSLPINNSLLSRGLLNNPDYQYLFSQLNLSAGSHGPTAAFNPQTDSPAPTSGFIAQIDAAGNLSIGPASGHDGDVAVLRGAQLTSADTSNHVGGKIALVGPNVTNAGTINTPDGQAILAAGLQVGFVAHNVSDPTLRGLDVSVGKVSDASYASGATGVAGTASNAGLIEAQRADVTAIGQNVHQNGVIDSSTSVSLNGRIDLLANYNAIALINGDNAFQGASNFYPTASGAVTFGQDSQTQILPELASDEAVVGTQLALSSLVNIEAKTIHFESNSFLLAPSAALPTSPPLPKSPVFAYSETGAILKAGVSLSAGNWLAQGDNSYRLTYASGQGGQVYLDSGATIDVSGSQNVSASVTENIVTGQLLGTELANSPLQRSGSLRGQKIQFDLRQVGVNADGSTWIGTPMADVSGYVGLIERKVGELTTAGGSVGINAGDSVVMQTGSNINVSGGYINYQGGNVQTTRVIQRGQIVDISQVNPDFAVSGIYNGLTVGSEKWNISQTFQSRLLTGNSYQAGYIQGGNGGAVSIAAPAMALDGNLYGNTVAGAQQVTPLAQLTKTYASATYLPTLTSVLAVPTLGSLSITFQAQDGSAAPYPLYSPTPPQVVFEAGSSLPAAGPFGAALPLERIAEVDLSPDLLNLNGFGNLTLVNSDGNIFVPANVSLEAPVGGAISFTAANINVQGEISAPSGKLSFTVYDFSPYLTAISNPGYDTTRGHFILGGNGSLRTTGLNVDNRPIAVAPGSLSQSPNGGKVTIIGNDVALASGAAIDVSGGAVISSGGKITYGAGGTIDIEAGQDPAYSSILGGHLGLDSSQVKLTGFSGGSGGSLILKSPLIQIGGSALSNGDTVASGNTLWLNPTDSAGNLLSPDFFHQGGFASFTLNSIGQAELDGSGTPTGQYLPGTLITANTSITPEALTLVAQTRGADVVFSIQELPQGQRAPVSLNFGVSGARDSFAGVLLARGSLVMEAGAVIKTDPQQAPTGGVKINANTVSLKGSIIAPGGAITITGGSNSSALLLSSSYASPTVYLGAGSLLSTAGTMLLTPNAFGLRTGSILAGGSITVDGNIFADTGAVLDVSGASGILDISPTSAGMIPVTRPASKSVTVATRLDSSGGSINLIGEQGMVTDATLLGSAGGPGAEGGTLSVSSGIYLTARAQTPLDPTLVVVQTSQHVFGNDAIGKNLIPEYGYNPLDGNTVLQTGYFGADSFNNSGFDSLILGGTVKFSGPVTITAKRSLNIGQAGVIFADSTVNLNAPYISLGQPFQSPDITQLLTNVFVSAGGAYYFSPTHGTGNLNVSAQFLDVGNLSLQGIGNASLTALNGDIRGYGTVDIAGNISLKAGQIYPTTENTFTIAAYDKNVMVASSSTGSNSVRLAASAAPQELMGSSLLGSIVTGISNDGLTVTLAANANTTITANTSVVFAPGSSTVTIAGSGTRQLPLSAGGRLNIYASNIVQGGVLRAPVGTINLGSGILGTTPVDLLTGSGLTTAAPTSVIPVTQAVTLAQGSVTSVSAVDPLTGKALVIPYGVNKNGVEWDDPAGNNITLAGNTVAGSTLNAIPDKTINISGVNVIDQPGAVIDISGGGDLFSYNFVTGTGGTRDILGTTNSFAILPGYQSSVAPLYSTSDYANSSLALGQQVYLKASNGLAAGYYTLLPARYALLPGAFLVTPTSGTPYAATITKATGSSVVAGYQINGFDIARSQAPIYSLYQISTPSVIAASAQYDVSSGNFYLKQSAVGASTASPLLPLDAGHLILAATQKMTIQGQVASQATAGGLGGLVDIASPSSILVYGPNTDLSSVPASTLALDSSGLSAFGAGSLLIGGYRQVVGGVDTVNVTTNSVTIDNAGASVVSGGKTLNGLSAPDVILVSNQSLTLAADSRIEYSPSATSQPVSTLALTGNGVLVRVSGNESDGISRTGVNPANTNPHLTIGSRAVIAGANNGVAGSLTLDSSYAIDLDPTAVLKANAVNLDSGQINIELTPPSIAPATQGLVLSGLALNNLQAVARDLSLLSYSSIDIFGSGQIGGTAISGQFPVASLTFHAAEIRGFSDSGGGGDVSINAQNVSIDNSPGGTVLGATVASGGSLSINAATIRLGTNQVNVDQYTDLNLNASSGIRLAGETKTLQADGSSVTGQGSLIASRNVTLNTPLITADTYLSSQAAPDQTITASNGNLQVNGAGSTPSARTGGLGGKLSLVGQNVSINSAIDLPSGAVAVHATTGAVSIGGEINVAGTARNFATETQYSSGGQVSLVSDHGSVNLAPGSKVNVAAASGGGNAGAVSVSAVNGVFSFAGATIEGAAGAGGQNGSFSLDTASLASLDLLDPILNAGGFTYLRSIRARTGDITINDNATARTFNLSTDTGSIFVNGTVDASGVTGGLINLVASGSVVLAPNAVLTVAAQNFDNAGKGGSVTLEAGAETNGNFANTSLNTSSTTGPLVDIQAGSTINLSVAANNAGSADLGKLNGTLLIRAPQTTGNTDLQVAPINGTILNASSIVVAGNQVFQATDGSIDNQKTNVKTNGTTFAGNTANILARLYNSNPNGVSLQGLTHVEPAAEIINPNGNLTLANNWDLSIYRFGPGVTGVVGSGAPGILTLRAAGNIVFNFGASLSDGFNPANTIFASANAMWTAPLLAAGDLSWSYQITAGSDFSSANPDLVQSTAQLQTSGLGGSIRIGQGAPNLPTTAISARATVLATQNFFQTIRTGTGDITMNAGKDVLLINNLATVYTAGTQAPALSGFLDPAFGTARSPQPPNYGAFYSFEGGNVTLTAQGNIAHQTSAGLADSSLELPTTWLYRQGALDASGNFVVGNVRNGTKQTSWWVDFSNFFEGVGALGGGNVTLTAGLSVNNVDAVAPTNARMPGATPSLASLVELGGGDVTVKAGQNINGGVYYVERGQGNLVAGNQILTNATRAAVPLGQSHATVTTWLPTTLFLGKGGFDVSAGGDLQLGPVANPFLLPQGANNSTISKSYFSTYADTDYINASSLTGAVTIKDNADTSNGSLFDWYSKVYLAPNGQSVATQSQPWLRSAETSVAPFSTVSALMPPVLNVTAFSGDINVIGGLLLAPSPKGTVNLLAAGSLNGFQVNGTDVNTGVKNWGFSTVNLSDANPTGLPSIVSPLSSSVPVTTTSIYTGVNSLFAESGATRGLVLQTQLALHASIDGNVLHANDPDPIHFVAGSGNISGFTLYSGKAAQIIAGQDISDIALYLQNVNSANISIVAAGRDILAYNPLSTLRLQAQLAGNAYIGQNITDIAGGGLGAPNAGDIQIGGPGTLEVLAGRNLDLGIGANNANGTQVGISSVGNARNPSLPFGGSDVIAAAGMGPTAGLELSQLDFSSFANQFLAPGTANATRYLGELGTLMGLPSGESQAQIWDAFNLLPGGSKATLALDIFYDVIRDAGRDHNDGSSPFAGTYTQGFAAIKTLFSSAADGAWPFAGDVFLTSREIKTTNGGNINLLAPGGQLTVGFDIAGNQPLDQGILTENGGNISIFTDSSVNVGTSRIFTLHGGNVIIWATHGDIAAGNSSKTVQSAPPTRVLIDPQSGSVQTDLAGLATGGGIGVLATVAGAPPADVDLIAPNGTVNAGDAGIRASGNINIAAVAVINAGNIQSGGKTTGTPTTSAPNVAGVSAASSAGNAASNSAASQARQPVSNNNAAAQQDQPSLMTVEVIGYGGDGTD